MRQAADRAVWAQEAGVAKSGRPTGPGKRRPSGAVAEAKAGLPVFATADGPGVWTLRVVVTPGGSRDTLAGLAEGRLRVRLRAKAVEGQANAGLTVFLAGCLGLRPRQVAIVSGEKSRKKTLRISAESEPDWSAVTGSGCD